MSDDNEPFETETFTGNPLFSQQFYETDRGREFVRGYSMMIYRPFGPASVAWGDSEPVPWGAGHHDETSLCRPSQGTAGCPATIWSQTSSAEVPGGGMCTRGAGVPCSVMPWSKPPGTSVL